MAEHIHARLGRSGVLTIRLSRPDKANAVSVAMYDAMSEMLNGAVEDPNVRVVVITGGEECFTSGNDISDLLSTSGNIQESPVMRFLTALSELNKPLVGAVCGVSVGIGTTMLLHADLVIAGINATFQLPFIDLALVPDPGANFLLPQVAGYQKAAEMILLGEVFSAAEAKSMGLINNVVPDDRVLAYAAERAEVLASKPLDALIAAKKLLKRGRADLDGVMEDEAKVYGKRLASPEAKEALAAFLERRPPDFSKVG